MGYRRGQGGRRRWQDGRLAKGRRPRTPSGRRGSRCHRLRPRSRPVTSGRDIPRVRGICQLAVTYVTLTWIAARWQRRSSAGMPRRCAEAAGKRNSARRSDSLPPSRRAVDRRLRPRRAIGLRRHGPDAGREAHGLPAPRRGASCVPGPRAACRSGDRSPLLRAAGRAAPPCPGVREAASYRARHEAAGPGGVLSPVRAGARSSAARFACARAPCGRRRRRRRRKPLPAPVPRTTPPAVAGMTGFTAL